MQAQFTSLEKQENKYLIPISMMFLTSLLVSALAVHRTIQIGPFIEPGGILIYPLTYFFSDVITEIYGYRISRQVLWYGLIFQFIFSILINGLLTIPSTSSWNDQKSFEYVFHPLIVYCIATSIATFIGGYFNIAIISKWKILVKGKYFWLRSLTATSIGEGIFTIIALPIIFIGSHSLSETIKIVYDAYLFKFAYGFIAVIPTTIFVSVIKKLEGIDFYDYGVNYNPFKLENSENHALS
jgi:queuosine precursor transporter